MTYAHVVDGVLVEVAERPPKYERKGTRPADGWWDLRDPAIRAARGWVEVAESPRPANTDAGTYDPGVELVAGVPTRTWTPRPWTPDELAARSAAINESELHRRARTALAANAAWLGRTAAPTNAQTLAHIDRLTRENTALIRLAIRALDTIDGT